MKKASMGGRSFNRVSQMPVLKKVRMRDTICVPPFYFDRLPKSPASCQPCLQPAFSSEVQLGQRVA